MKGKSRLDEYEIIKEIGHGSYGEVYQAVHKGNQKTIAIKVIDKLFMAREAK